MYARPWLFPLLSVFFVIVVYCIVSRVVRRPNLPKVALQFPQLQVLFGLAGVGSVMVCLLVFLPAAAPSAAEFELQVPDFVLAVAASRSEMTLFRYASNA